MSGDSRSWEDPVMGRHVKPYPPELRERAVRMVRDSTPAYPSQWAAIKGSSESRV